MMRFNKVVKLINENTIPNYAKINILSLIRINIDKDIWPKIYELKIEKYHSKFVSYIIYGECNENSAKTIKYKEEHLTSDFKWGSETYHFILIETKDLDIELEKQKIKK